MFLDFLFISLATKIITSRSHFFPDQTVFEELPGEGKRIDLKEYNEVRNEVRKEGVRKLRQESLGVLPTEIVVEIGNEGINVEPTVEMLGQIQEFSSDKRVSWESNRYARI